MGVQCAGERQGKQTREEMNLKVENGQQFTGGLVSGCRHTTVRHYYLGSGCVFPVVAWHGGRLVQERNRDETSNKPRVGMAQVMVEPGPMNRSR